MFRYVKKGKNPERRKAILSILLRGDRSFSEIDRDLTVNGKKWSPSTLSLYLDGLIEDKCISKISRGKRPIYHILLDSPEVNSFINRLGIGRVIVRGRTELPGLSEAELLDNWIESLKFALLNFFKIYLAIGSGAKGFKSRGDGATVSREKFLDKHFLDLIDLCRVYGGELAKGVEEGRLDRDKVLEAISNIFEEIKRKRTNDESISL